MTGIGSIALVLGFAAVVTASVLWNAEGKRLVSNLFGFSGLCMAAGGMLLIITGLTAPVTTITREVPVDVKVPGVEKTVEQDNTLTV